MIKLFRIFRRELLLENKFSKYLLYALGEVVLVVIGILIAIQINGWNEDQKANVLEKAYYQQFLDELLKDEVQIDDLIVSGQNRLQASNELIGLLQNPNPDIEIVANRLLASVSEANRKFIPTNASFEDAKSSGNLKIISDVSLKNNLSYYFTKVQAMATDSDLNAERMVTSYLTKETIGTGIQFLKLVDTNLDPVLVDKSALDGELGI